MMRTDAARKRKATLEKGGVGTLQGKVRWAWNGIEDCEDLWKRTTMQRLASR
jgi:hypothetical protein